MTSKAEIFAAKFGDVENTRPELRIKSKYFNVLIAKVDVKFDEPFLKIYSIEDDDYSIDLHGDEPLQLARWILDVFGDGEKSDDGEKS